MVEIPKNIPTEGLEDLLDEKMRSQSTLADRAAYEVTTALTNTEREKIDILSDYNKNRLRLTLGLEVIIEHLVKPYCSRRVYERHKSTLHTLKKMFVSINRAGRTEIKQVASGEPIVLQQPSLLQRLSSRRNEGQ